MKTKISFISLGCDKNLVDSEIMLGLIDKKGYVITDDEYEADIIIINSCGFIMEASQEGIEKVLDAADMKKNGRCKGIIVTGCMAQRYAEQIFEELPEVDAIVGTGDFEKIGDVIDRLISGEKSVSLITDKNNTINPENSVNRMISTVGFGYLKIAEGCDNHCTYCTIPSLRGRYRSRTIESLADEAQMMAEKGIKELILVAQDTAMYGVDIYKRKSLHILLSKLSEIEDIKWIRLLYCYPENIDDNLISEIKNNPKVLHYIDMPIQHSEDKILKLMGRKSSRSELINIISKLRTEISDICIRTTLITGFPGEDEYDFKGQCDFIELIRFDRLGVFEYSREEGTPAYKLPNQVDDNIKAERKEYLLQLQKRISADVCSKYIGRTLDVIIEGKIDGEENVYASRSYRDCYEIDGFVFFKCGRELLAGDFYKVKITKSGDYDLIGELSEEE